MKPLLVQCSLSAIKDKESYFGAKYVKIKKRRGHKKAIIAIARMMLTSIYHMIRSGEVFNPSDYQSLTNPNPKSHKSFTVANAIELLKQSGYSISKINNSE